MVTSSTKSSVDIDNKEHEETPDAKRILIVDESGNVFNALNPFPVDTELTIDGNLVIDNVSVFATDISDSTTTSFALVDVEGHQQIDVLTLPDIDINDISKGIQTNDVKVTMDGEQVSVSVDKYDDTTNPIRKDMEGGGKVSVGTSAVEVTFTGTTNSIIITADIDNTGKLFIGESNVTNTGANAITFLEAGDVITIDYDDTDNAVYVVSDTSSQNFWKGATL